MAFTNVRTIDGIGGLKFVFGDFNQTLGAASQTLTVTGGRVVGCLVNPQVSAEPVDMETGLYSISTSGDVSTLTIYGNATVTAGTFFIILNLGG